MSQADHAAIAKNQVEAGGGQAVDQDPGGQGEQVLLVHEIQQPGQSQQQTKHQDGDHIPPALRKDTGMFQGYGVSH